MTTTCKNCGESLWVHRELDFSGVWQEGDTCEEFEKDMSEEKIELLAKLAAQLPPNLSADWRDTNHFELHDNSEGGDYFWLDLSDLLDYLRQQGSPEMPCETEHGKRIGLVMDCIEALSKSTDALNTTADLREKLRVAEDALRHCARCECAHLPDNHDDLGECLICDCQTLKPNVAGKALAAITD